MKKFPVLVAALASVTLMAISCQSTPEPSTNATPAADSLKFGGYASQEKWGEHLLAIGGCHDCHTPKKFGPNGMEPDMTKALAGHLTDAPVPDVNKAEMAKKGLAVTNDLTVWVGPWGVSYAANLTPDSTGILGWKEEQFIYALRKGIFKGLPGSRPLLPPMPWQSIGQMTDDELKALFAYLKTVTPIRNVVPQAEPPAGAK